MLKDTPTIRSIKLRRTSKNFLLYFVKTFSQKHTHPSTITSLDLAFSQVDDEQLAAIASCSLALSLVRLNLSYCRNLTPAGLVKLTDLSSSFKKLEELNLEGVLNEFEDDRNIFEKMFTVDKRLTAFNYLGQGLRMESLRYLSLANTAVQRESLKKLI